VDKRYFGTDGIRGRVGQTPITAEFVLKLGWAAGRVLSSKHYDKVLIGKDTRISGYMFESALQAGLSAAGINIALLGPMPTPAIAYLTRTLHACAGIVISASHNPYYDNGIKFFARNGQKLPDERELQIEAMLDEPMETVDPAELGKAERVVDAAGRYIEFCKSTVPPTVDLSNLKIVVDCANGATYHVAPNVFTELGATVIPIHNSPNGLNINLDCGSTKPGILQETVKANDADLGIAFDGDGDRVIMVDHTGEVVDGDELLFIIARDRQLSGNIAGGVVGTLMSNLGLEIALKEIGLELHRAKVGDRYVLECLRTDKLILGGESSGHIICLDKTSTGDGIVSALQVLTALVESNSSLHDLRKSMSKFPQVTVNVPLPTRGMDPGSLEAVQRGVHDTERQLGDMGRVLLRPSGTEPVVRVMVEGVDALRVRNLAQELAGIVRQAVGSS